MAPSAYFARRAVAHFSQPVHYFGCNLLLYAPHLQVEIVFHSRARGYISARTDLLTQLKSSTILLFTIFECETIGIRDEHVCHRLFVRHLKPLCIYRESQEPVQYTQEKKVACANFH
jgi:hypothetical protein